MAACLGRVAWAQPAPEPPSPEIPAEPPSEPPPEQPVAPTAAASPPAAPAPAPAEAPAPAPPPAPAEPPAPAASGPSLDVTALVQARYQIVRREDSGADEPPFVLRRARAQVEVEPLDRLHLTLEAELTDSMPVRDASARYRFARAFEVTAGHFKRPFGANELDSSWEIIASERGVTSERLRTYSLAGRDIGAMVSGRLKRLLDLRWAAGTFSGLGDRAVEDVAGRLTISPGPLTIGGAAVYSRGRDEVGMAASIREAWAVEGDVTLELPFLFARFEATSGTNRERAHTGVGPDGALVNHFGHFFALYGIATGRIRWCQYVLEPGFKVERFDSSVKYGEDALLLLTPLVRLSVGEHLQLLVEGNIVLADDFLQATFRPAERRLVVQVGGRT